MRTQVRAQQGTPLAASAEWYERLAALHAAPADPALAAGHAAEAAKQDAVYQTNFDIWQRSGGRDLAAQSRAGHAYREALRQRRLAFAASTDPRPRTHVNLAVAAAQVRAVDSGANVTTAAAAALTALAAHDHAEIAQAAAAHPTFRLLGLRAPVPPATESSPVSRGRARTRDE